MEEQIHHAQPLDYMVSLVLVELNSSLDFDGRLELSGVVGSALIGVTGRSTAIFQYQGPHQLALVSVSNSVDATGYLLLRCTELISSRAWSVRDETVLPSGFVGFSTTTTSGYNAAELIRRAEQVLAFQRRELPTHE